MDPVCSLCQELWRVYGRTTNEHLNLERQLQNAENSCDQDARKALVPAVRKAAVARATARTSLLQHENSHR